MSDTGERICSEPKRSPARKRFTSATGAWISLIVCVVSYSLMHFIKVGVDSFLVCVFMATLFSFFIFGFFALLGVHYRNEGKTPTGKVLTDYTLHVHGDDLLLVQKRIGDWYSFFYVGVFCVLFVPGMFAGSISFLLQSIREPELKSIWGFLGFGFFAVVASLIFFPLFFLRHFFLPWKRKILILNRDSVWVKYGKKSDIPDRIEALKAKPDDAKLQEVLDEEILQMLKRFETPSERGTVLEEIRMESRRVWDEAADDADRARLARQKEEEEFLEEVEDARSCLQILRQGKDPNDADLPEPDEKEEIPRSTRRSFKPTTIAGILFAVFVVSAILGALKVEWMVSRWKGFAFWSFLFFAFQVYEIVRERRYRMRVNLSLLDLILKDYTLSTQADKVILVRKYLRGLWFVFSRMFPLGLVCLGFGSLLGFLTWFIYGTRPLNGITAGIFPILAIMWLMWGKVFKILLVSLSESRHYFLPSRRRILILSRDALNVIEGNASNVSGRLEKIEAQPDVVLLNRPAHLDHNLLILRKLYENPLDRQTILEELRRKVQLGHKDL